MRWRSCALAPGRVGREVAQKAHPDLVAMQPDALAAPVRAAGCREHEEEFAGSIPLSEPRTMILAPVSETSPMRQSRCQVPSIAMMLAE
jgi:hypothetical protein